MTKFKNRLIKIGIIALMPILALLLCLNNTYAYYLNSDGDVQSNNLADMTKLSTIVTNNLYDYSVNNQTLILTINSSTNDPYIYFRDFITLKANTTYSFYYISNNEFQYVGLTYPSNSSDFYHLFGTTRNTYTIGNEDVTCGLGIEGMPNTSYEIKIMIYEGDYNLDYEPYQLWIASDKYQKQSIYSLFNGASASLWNYYSSVEDSTIVALDTISVSVDERYLTLDNLPNIKSALLSGTSGEDWGYSNSTKYYIALSLNRNQLNGYVRFSEFNSNNQYLALTGSEFGLYDKNIYSTDEQSLVINTMGNEYTILRIFNDLDYNNNWRLSLTFSSSDYNSGFSDGYSSGYSSAISNGNKGAYIEGYNNGFNEGACTNLETNGMKTLFNSILSYPVNMIRSVFNFDFMGVNIASIIMFVISVGIVIFVVRKFKE